MNKNEFEAFLLIYAAQTNFIESEEEIAFIESKFSANVINMVKSKIKSLNDYQRLDFITKYIKNNNYDNQEIESILLDIKRIYNSDGVFDRIEKTIYNSLKKLLRSI